MRAEGVVDEGDAALDRVIRDFLRGADAADPPGIDLDEADARMIDRCRAMKGLWLPSPAASRTERVSRERVR